MSKPIITTAEIEGFEESHNCYCCKSYICKEKLVRGHYEYKLYCKEHRARLDKIGWCPQFDLMTGKEEG